MNESATEFTPVQAGILQRKCDCGQHTIGGGKCDECGENDQSLQRATRNSELGAQNPNGVPSIVREVLNSPGQSLDATTRAFFELRFGHDFSQVRVHTDARAAQSAQQLNALAYTQGTNIVLASGQYSPATLAGKKLLAHELTHVLQQHATGPLDIQRKPAEMNDKKPTPAPVSDDEIDALDLAATAKAGAEILKKKHPGITFTSGRRNIAEQAHAMASNIVSSKDRKWIEKTYASAATLQKWVDDNPKATTVDKISKGLEDTMNGMKSADLGKVSKHLSGEAFDVKPQKADAAAIKKDIKALPGLSKFLEKEGGLVRWHAQFKLADFVARTDDPLEQQADLVAEQVCRTDDASPWARGNSFSGAQTNKALGTRIRNAASSSVAATTGGTLQRATRRSELGTQSPNGVPSIVHEVLNSPGQPLDATTRAFFEPRFGHDFSRVRVHTDAKAAESAGAVNALAYTVGPNLVFGSAQYAPETAPGRQLLAHELSHVVQSSRADQSVALRSIEVTDQESAAEREAEQVSHDLLSDRPLRVSASAPPSVHRAKKGSAKMPLGQFSFEMSPYQIGGQPGMGMKELVGIEFLPEANGPITDSIVFTQIAKVTFDQKDVSWGTINPDEADLDKMLTSASDRIHMTKAGETLASISQAHYGTPDRAYKIFDANSKVLNVPSKRMKENYEPPYQDYNPTSRGPTTPDMDYPIPAGLQLTIPEAVAPGFHADIDPKGKKSRQSSVDPNVAIDYPYVKQVGKNLPNKTPVPAQMIDEPGNTVFPSVDEFETAARSDQLGLFYGSVRWGFRYSPLSISREWFEISPNVSDTFGAASVEFNKLYKNKHAVKKGDTLNSISQMYFGSTAKANDILQANLILLKNVGLDDALTSGLMLNVPSISK